jgi:hypothetical protein
MTKKKIPKFGECLGPRGHGAMFGDVLEEIVAALLKQVILRFAARLAARHSNPNAGHARSEHSCGSTQPKARTQNKFKYTLLDP